MGSQILKIPPFSYSKTLVFTNPAYLSRSLQKSAPSRNLNTQFRTRSSKPRFGPVPTFSASRFGVVFPQSQRSFRGSVTAMAAPGSVQKSDEEWRAVLSPEQFRILRKKGTEYDYLLNLYLSLLCIMLYPGTGEYNKLYDEGIYTCAGCGTPLYKSTTKFDSGCGWPAFFDGLPGAINRHPDPDGRRVEITCAACGGHLGHVFKGEGFRTPTDERHCVNSVSLKFTPADSSS
ncbi:hypothetical protein RHMOL_Rhmol05G0117600 [Rhododendron molle]|uniref:Uncharacterized protein n=1 Tax=Rhododendron molle TaxID=49168 RepID=A0ACC0NQ07_RHOML|nr:hypothetical protein RHMOL_Rhmol05G0117600 [Rhododendron molle]